MSEPEIYLPSQHPDESELVAHAAGQLDATRRVLLEGHLACCPSCSETWRQVVAPGGRMLREMPEEAPPPHLLGSILSRLRSDADKIDPYAEVPLRQEVKDTLPRLDESLVWSPPTGHDESPVAVARLAVDPQAEAMLFLLSVPGGERIPRHEHLGPEHVLCVRGACTDEFTRLGPGDYYSYEAGTQHYPLMEPGETCWIVVRVEKGTRFLD